MNAPDAQHPQPGDRFEARGHLFRVDHVRPVDGVRHVFFARCCLPEWPTEAETADALWYGRATGVELERRTLDVWREQWSAVAPTQPTP